MILIPSDGIQSHIAALMSEQSIARIVTLDTDFHRFDFLEVVDPLRLA